jgi:hypothetical protein
LYVVCHDGWGWQAHKLRRLIELKVDAETEHELITVLKRLTKLWYA